MFIMNRKAFSLIEILIVLSIILATTVLYSLYENIRYRQNINKLISDINYSSSYFYDKTGSNINQIRIAGEDVRQFIDSQLSFIKFEGSYNSSTYKHDFGTVTIQPMFNETNGATFRYTIRFIGKNKDRACREVAKYISKNSRIPLETIYINNNSDGVNSSLQNRGMKDISDLCETQKTIFANLDASNISMNIKK